MTAEKINQNLVSTLIPMEEDSAVPMNGTARKLPYMVARQDITITGSDNGRVGLKKISWTVALFSTARDEAAERKIAAALALAGVGRVIITRFPDGTPYQTNFEFTSIEPQ